MVIKVHAQEDQDLYSMPCQHMGSPIQPSILLECGLVTRLQNKLGDHPAHILLLLLS